MTPKSQRIQEAIQDAGAQRQGLLKVLLRLEPLIVGTVYDVKRRCGKPSCHCAGKPAHPQTLLIYMEKGNRRCRFVRRQDAEKVRLLWLRYKECKKAWQDIRAINQRELRLLKVQIHKRRVRFPL
ncbi:MAG: hypothetical protein HY547_01300 [Elusimicrobia bacterium]|nr:hypothetical protein [Elusimicrobiota bacterium]